MPLGVPALAAGLLALGAIAPALAQDEPPIGPSATIGTLSAARAAHLIAEPRATASPVAPAAPVPAPDADAYGAATMVAASPTASATPAAAAVAASPTPASAASAAVAAATPSPSTDKSAAAGGPKTFLINDGTAPAGGTSVTPEAAPSPAQASTTAPVGTAAAAASPAATPAVTVSNAPPPLHDVPSPASAGTEQVENVPPEDAPPGTAVIPSAAEQREEQQASQVSNYEANQQMPIDEPQLHSLQEFMNEGVNASPLGVELEEGARRGRNGHEVDGLLVVALQPGSPADRAGLQAGHRAAHDVVEGAAVAASLVFPPAVLAVPVIETMQLGENYDLIIGIDGNRVTNFMDFQDRMRDALPGETVYLNILRNGKRMQVAVTMPPADPSKLQP